MMMMNKTDFLAKKAINNYWKKKLEGKWFGGDTMTYNSEVDEKVSWLKKGGAKVRVKKLDNLFSTVYWR